MRHLITLATALTILGCNDSSTQRAQQQNQQPAKQLAGAAVAKLKTTQDVKEFDPNGAAEVISPDVNITNPLTGALEAYEPLKEKVAGMGIDHAVQLFHALEGRYPKDHDEFMNRIIKQNNLRLPNLPADREYQYDVANHQLRIVRKN